VKWSALAVTLSAATVATAQPRKIESVLPLKRIRLYETGVGYFQRTGRLTRGVDVSLPMPAGHLDDALDTLVVLGAQGKTSVAGVEFSSAVSRSMARALAGLPKQEGTPLGFVDLLGSMKGAEVTLKAAHATVHGRVVDVLKPAESDLERCVPPAHAANNQSAPCVMQKQTTLVLLTDDSEVRRFATADIVSVRPEDPALRARLNAALGALSARGAQTRKILHLMASGSKNVTLGYIAETPVWRSTYRLVLDDRGQAALQGWALIHNDTDENWHGVRVELVNGRPDSFLFPLAGPRYARRPLATPEHELSSVPQLLDTTVDNMWTGDSEGGGMSLSGVGEGGGGAGYGIGLGSISTVGHGGGTGSSDDESSLLSIGNLASFAPAQGVESGALFRYSLKSPIDLSAHSSALVPFTQQIVPARRIAWFSAPDTTARSAVLLKNDTQQTLPPGPVSVFADGGFAGESALDRVEPSEQRFVRFGLDLDVKLELGVDDVRDHVKLVSFDGQNLVEHFVRHHALSYDIENQSSSPRAVYLVLDLVRNATVQGADEMAFDSEQGRALAVFRVKARSRGQRGLNADEGLSHRYALASLTSTELDKLAKEPELPAATRPILRAAADRLLEAEVRRGALPKREAELAQDRGDIGQLRDNVRAIGAAHNDAAELMTKRLLAAQDREHALERRIEALKTEARGRVESARAELEHLNATLPGAMAAR
jgi:hypothetical protein